MRSKTRLCFHCSKRGDNTMNLAMSRKTNPRLAHPINDKTKVSECHIDDGFLRKSR